MSRSCPSRSAYCSPKPSKMPCRWPWSRWCCSRTTGPRAAGRAAKIALMGPLADNGEDLLGSWYGRGRGGEVTTVRQGLEKTFGHIAYWGGASFETGTDAEGAESGVHPRGEIRCRGAVSGREAPVERRERLAFRHHDPRSADGTAGSRLGRRAACAQARRGGAFQRPCAGRYGHRTAGRRHPRAWHRV